MTAPNIIFMHSHNTGRCVQPYGHAVPTPNLQRLAEDGMLFTRAFATAPTCSPSRASFLSSQYPHRCGMFGLAHRGFRMHDYNQHAARLLQQLGYWTTTAGVEHTAGSAAEVGYNECLDTATTAAAAVAPAAAAFLSRIDRPFFLNVGLNETHRPFPDPEPETHPAEDARYCLPPLPLPNTPQTRADTAAFKHAARRMDAGYGQILAAVDGAGLRENTLVFCFADHGLQFPLNMCNLTDHGTAVYLIARGPGGFSGGKVSDAMVSLLDLLPTVCTMAGGAVDDFDGLSLIALANDPAASHHRELFAEVSYHAAYEPQRSVRTERYKYIRRYDQRDRLVLPNTDDGLSKTALLEGGWEAQPRDQEQLYDLFFDPAEAHNLIADSRLAAVRQRLSARLDEWQRETADPIATGEIPVPAGALANDPDGRTWHEPPQVIR